MPQPLLDHVPAPEAQRVFELARTRTFRRDEVIVHEGDPANTVHMIEQGRVAVLSANRHGQRVMLAVLGPGEHFGELALVGSGAQRSASVIALEPTVTRSILDADFARLRRQHPEVTEVIVALLAEQIRRLSSQLLDALFLPAESRVRKRLLELTERYDQVAGGVSIPLRQEDLAELAGTSRATVNRVLREEARRGSVALTRGCTTVLDRDRLGELIW